MKKYYFSKIKSFLPFLGLAGLYFLFILLIVFLFNYYSPTSAAWLNKINPFVLLIRWDSFHYLNIVIQESYSLVFFPLYPLLVRVFSLLFSPIFSGFLVSFISLATALYFLKKLIEINYNKEISQKSIILLLLFPAGVFLSLIYTESLFLALTVAFFYFIEKKYWLRATLIGFFASLTRNVGIFLWIIYLVYFLNHFYPTFKDIKMKKLALLTLKKKEFLISFFIPLGLIVYCFYCYFVSGDFFAFINGQKAWSEWHIFTWPWDTFSRIFKYYIFTPIGESGLFNFLRIVVIEFGSFLLLLIATIYWFLKKHWPYAILCLLHTILFSSMYPMTSVNRYTLVIFPIFIFLANATKKYSWLFYSVLMLFTAFLIFNIFLISNGSWVG